MKLVEAQVRTFRNILDSVAVNIQDVTCLVGKNESGKTAFLQALYLLNPARSNVKFSVPDQYPAWLEKKDRLRGVNLEEIRPVRAVFELAEDEINAVESRFGKGAVASNRIEIERDYKGSLYYNVNADEPAIVTQIINGTSLPASIATKAEQVRSLSDLTELITTLKSGDDKHTEEVQAASTLEGAVKRLLGTAKIEDAIWAVIKECVPKFFYYAEYTTLPYSVKIRELLQTDEKNLTDDLLTARSLLRLAAADKDYLLNPDYERRKRELENVANALTDDVLKYWSQNPELRVLPDIAQTTENAPNGRQTVLDELKIRIWDQRHSLSLPIAEHSTGFQWFFSFLAAFSEYEFKETPVIILLDEPALGLHARAQADFLRFIEERLSVRHQVIYTTHSPFMIQPGKLERVRIVEDRGREEGAKVSKDVMTTDPDTLFPLQGALGYDLAQHLFITPHNLIVEGTSDFTYLSVISDYLAQKDGRVKLDGRWSIVPVGGADAIPTFVALLGHHLDVTVLVDSRKGGHQRLADLATAGYLVTKRIIAIGEVMGQKLADIEDIFTIEDYLLIFNRAFGTTIKPGDLTGTDPITSRIARYQGVDRFDHGRPADILLRCRPEILPQLSEETLSRFERLFDRINSTI